MSKLYQPIKNNPYRLRDRVYDYTVWDIRKVAKYKAGYYDEPFLTEFRPSADLVQAVETALQEVPDEYRSIVFENLTNETALPAGYRNKKTTLEKAKFIYRVAELTGRPLGARKIVHTEYDWR